MSIGQVYPDDSGRLLCDFVLYEKQNKKNDCKQFIYTVEHPDQFYEKATSSNVDMDQPIRHWTFLFPKFQITKLFCLRLFMCVYKAWHLMKVCVIKESD